MEFARSLDQGARARDRKRPEMLFQKLKRGNKRNLYMKENLGKPYYGYRINKYITGVLIGLGIVGIVLGIIFATLAYPTWVLVLCWALGAILLIWGIFWPLSMGFVNNTRKVEHLQNNFAEQLRAV